MFFPLENLNETYKYLMSLPQTFSESAYICTEINHKEVAISHGLEIVHISIAEGLDKSNPMGGVSHWVKCQEENSLLVSVA